MFLLKSLHRQLIYRSFLQESNGKLQMRRITKARIKYISLVPRGANQLPVIYKADNDGVNGTIDFSLLLKASSTFDEKGELYGVVYSPELRDSQGDIASAEVIKDMMYDASKNGVQIDIRHNEKALTKDQAFVAESFIIQKGDQRFEGMKNYSGNPVDVTGGWGVVIKIDDPALRKEYREGKWNGLSMGGVAQVEADKSADTFIDALAKKFGLNTNNGDFEMKPEELEAALAKNNTALVTTLKELVEPVLKVLSPTKKDGDTDTNKSDTKAPVFSGEPTVENLRKHRLAVQRYEIIKGIDFNNAESVAKGEEALTALEGKKDGDTDTNKEESDEVKRLTAELAKARKRSNQSQDTQDQPPVNCGLSKEDMDLIANGRKIGEIANRNRGYAK